MHNFRISILTALITISVLSHGAFAAAFQLYEVGTPIVATAGVGQAAIISDASTAYFNPAGMGLLPGTDVMVGSQILLPFIHFSTNSSNTIKGDNGGNAGLLTPGMNLYAAFNYSPCLKFGVAVTTPYGGALNYNDGWVGRYVVQNALFYAINLNPSMAYRFNQWLSVGVGASVEYMSLQQDTALPVSNLVDGQINLKTDNVNYGYNLGVLMIPYQSTRIGIAYRSQIVHNLHGNITFLRFNQTPSASTKMTMPQNVIASLSQDLSERFTLLAELGWSNWSSMKDSILNVRNVSAVTPLNWHDTYRAGLGGQFKATQALLLQAGVSYDSSPTETVNRMPDLPMDKQYRIGAGVIYAMMNTVKLGLSYEYWNLGKGDINNTSSNGVLAGSYSKNFANTLQASFNVEV